jgi:hypothetical protein
MIAVAAPLTHAKRGRGEPGSDLGHEVLVLPWPDATATSTSG